MAIIIKAPQFLSSCSMKSFQQMDFLDHFFLHQHCLLNNVTHVYSTFFTCQHCSLIMMQRHENSSCKPKPYPARMQEQVLWFMPTCPLVEYWGVDSGDIAYFADNHE